MYSSGLTNRQAYRVMDDAGLLHRPICRKAEVYQAAKEKLDEMKEEAA